LDVIHFLTGRPPALAGAETNGEDGGFFWLDVTRSESDWHERAQKWLGTQLHEKHVRDSLNETHMPYYDGVDDYDMLIVRTLCPDCPSAAPSTHPIAFLLMAKAVVSIRPVDNPLFHRLHQRFLSAKRNSPTSPAMLLYLLLDEVTEALLAHRDVLSDLLSNWQDRLLDSTNGFNDWQDLMRLRGQLQRLEIVTERQLDVQDKWREETTYPLDRSLTVHFNDLQEHLHRVYSHVIVTQNDIDALVQIYFSAKTQQTNQILQFLTIVSAIFLPLNLLAALFGMNFTHLPLLQTSFGLWIVLGFMGLVAISLLSWFRWRHWL